MSKSTEKLYHHLETSGIEYLALTSLEAPRVNVVFTGVFEGHPIVWQATIIALNSSIAKSGNQYITVNVENNHSVQVEVGLPLDSIDEPAVLKTITMLRQYKNLRRGRHDFKGIQKQEK